MLRRSVLALALSAAALAGCGTDAPAPVSSAGTRDLELNRGGDRPLPTTVWLPDRAGAVPLIYFSHGLTSQPSDYAALLSAWTAAGFAVTAPKYPHTWNQAAEYDADDVVNQPADAQYVITGVVEALTGRIDPSRVAAAGHSAGGITTVGLFSGSRDARLKAGLIISGRQMPQPAPFSGTAAPLLFVQGRLDDTVTYEQAYGAYNEVAWPKAFLELPEGGHLPHRDDPALVAAATTDFWRWSLNDDGAARARLPRVAGLTDQL
ncbi:alpha/beta hydrolase [Actinoplanes sp. NPDC051861]|uniref:alpha/beta hydrolase family protein n=1 Tax=Actinoplanes sp. NPDC051861 TaxID=3155170 RepID=UPI00342ECC1E